MNQRWKVTFAALCALFLPGAVFGQKVNLPDGVGKAELIHDCTACHNTDLVVQVKKTPEAWKRTVYDMADRGVDASDEDLDKIVRYLSMNFGIEKSTATATQSAIPSGSGAAARLSPAEIGWPEGHRFTPFLVVLPGPSLVIYSGRTVGDAGSIHPFRAYQAFSAR